ncbi:MAG: LysR substrate-binding domain-containing protein [Paracoccaceae bacterium]
MDIADQLRAFVATARTGSFTAAADQLGISNRLTSKYVAELEARLSVRLFQRTTRKVGLTSAGEDLMARAPAILDELDAVLAEVTEGSGGLTGTIRISAPITLGEVYLAGMLGRFAQAHPDLTVDLRLSDRYADLAREGIDLAFRIGRFDMASLKVRRLGGFQSVLVASPDYLARNSAPATPSDLERHECIIDTNRTNPRRWTFQRHGAAETVEVHGRMHVNSARGAVDLASQGLGIAYAPRFALREAIDGGALVPLLGDYAGESSLLGAAYLEGRTLPRKVRALIDFALEDIRAADIL